MPAREPDAGAQAGGKAPRAAQPGGGYGPLPAAERRRREAARAAKLDATLRREAAMPLDEYLAYLQTPESNVVYNPKDPEDVAAYTRHHAELQQRFGVGDKPTAEVLSSRGRADGDGTPEDPIDVQGDLDRALDLLSEGKHVRLNQPDEVSTLIGKLAKIVNDDRAAGRTPPAIDLCQVTVAGTNLFCVGNKGHRRIDMPQLEGTALPGTTADTLPRNAKGFVEVSDQFRQALEDAGVTVTTRQRPANRLRATQAELNGGIVARIAGEIEQGRTDDPIYVTRDGYIIDGHHVWAANVAVDTKDNRLGDVQMPVHEIDMDIGAAIDFARQFAKDIGVESASVTVPANRS